MKLIVGLGNPGLKYAKSRHNVGYMQIDVLSKLMGINLRKGNLNYYGKGDLFGEEIILSKPSTYMNRSGMALLGLKGYYKLKTKDIIVVYDDYALPFGKIRLRGQGTSGGHNGLQSIIENLGTNKFMRVRIGIGDGSERRYGSEYVLSNFQKGEEKELSEVLTRVSNAIKVLLEEGLERSMNFYN